MFHSQVIAFFDFYQHFFQQVLFFCVTKNICAVFGCKANYKTQKQKKDSYQIDKVFSNFQAKR